MEASSFLLPLRLLRRGQRPGIEQPEKYLMPNYFFPVCATIGPHLFTRGGMTLAARVTAIASDTTSRNPAASRGREL